MRLKYQNTTLNIYIKNTQLSYDINKDIDVNSIRKKFNKTISSLSLKNNNLYYWTMKLSERNTLVNNLFLDICRIIFIESLLLNNKDLRINTSNETIYLYFKYFSKVDIKSAFIFNLKVFFETYKPYLKTIKFIIKRIFFHKKYANKTQAKNLSNYTVVQTWVGDDNFINGNFKDSYYGNLVEYLKLQKQKVITWPIFYNLKNENNIIKYIRSNKKDFLFVEDYLKIFDYLFGIILFYKTRFLKLGQVNIGGRDYTKVFKHYQNKESVSLASIFYSFTKKLRAMSSDNIIFVHHHENMIPEKALICGVRKYLPKSKLIGYFHTTKPKNQLCLEYSSIDEFKIAPKPDAIVFNSDKYKKYFEKKYIGFPMYNGTAFKQQHLGLKLYKDRNPRKLKKNILVLFSGTLNDVQLMFSMLSGIQTNNYKFFFRMHPLNQFKVMKYYSKSNYIVVDDKILDEIIQDIDKVITTYSGVAVEFASCGFDVGLVYNKKELLLNPFDDTNLDKYHLISDNNTLMDFLQSNFKKLKITNLFNLGDKYNKIFLDLIKKYNYL